MPEITLQVDCERLAVADPFGMSAIERRDRVLQYSSLIGRYVDDALNEEIPQFDSYSRATDDISSIERRSSEELTAYSSIDWRIERLVLKYHENKAGLVKRLNRLYGIFASLAAGNYAAARIPEGARLADVFTSHHTQMFLFETETPKGTYIRLTKNPEKVKNFKNTESVTYRLLDEADRYCP